MRDEAAGKTVILAQDGSRLIGCGFAHPAADHLYLAKLAVAHRARRRGIMRGILACAEGIARDQGLGSLQLLTRIELLETHAAFEALGFARIGTFTHPGFARPTSFRFARPVA